MNINLGRIFHKMGLPAWTFIGIGVSAIWFSYLGAIIERGIRDWLGIDEQTRGWTLYAPQVFIFLLPFLIVGAIWLYQILKHQTAKILSRDSSQLRQPEGKKGLILLVSSKENSAMFAIDYHFTQKKTLKTVWLIPSNRSDEEHFGYDTLAIAGKIKQLCKENFGNKLEVIIHKTGVSPADSQDTFDYVNRLFRQSGYQASEVIADFTGGTKPMSVGMIMACLPSDRELEYVSLNGQRESKGPFLIDYQHRAFDLIG